MTKYRITEGICALENLMGGDRPFLISYLSDSVNIKILNAGAWSRASERIPVSLPTDVSFKIV